MSTTSDGELLADALAAATGELARAGCETPRLDAEVLLSEVLGGDRARLVLDAREPLSGDVRVRFAGLIVRRAEREPVAYIIGRRGFRHIELRCDRRALIPRPETELLVEVGLGLAAGTQVLDVGTGSGAVALALKHERPDLTVIASDISQDALKLAADNAVALDLDVGLAHADLRSGIPCDALLANLPYVESGAELAPEITRYEPASALYAGEDGLDLIRRLCGELDGVGFVALEHGSGQGPAVSALVGSAGFGSVQTLQDLAGHDRVTVGRR